jgi:hypothetical protein
MPDIPIQVANANHIATPVATLTAYASGMPIADLSADVEFFIPSVQTPKTFKYYVQSAKESYGVIGDDGVGENGLPKIITLPAGSTQTGVNTNRGLDTPINLDDLQSAIQSQGWSEALEKQARIDVLSSYIDKARYLRAMALGETAAGTPTSWVANAAASLANLKAHITTIAKKVGGRNNVRVLMGSTAYTLLQTGIISITQAYNPATPITQATIAQALEIPQANLRVSYTEINTKAAGLDKALAPIMTATRVFVFGATTAPTRDDPSWAKCFWSMRSGVRRYVYTYSNHPNVEYLGIGYLESMTATNTDAIMALTATESS